MASPLRAPLVTHIHFLPTPVMAGVRAAKANLIPGLIVQCLMALVVALYYLYKPFHGVLQQVAAVKAHWGIAFTAIGAVIAGGLVPEILRILCFQHGRLRRANAENLLFTVPFWAYSGCMVDLFYHGQGFIFGTAVNIAVIVKKVLVDQLIYNPVYAAPITVIAYDWKNSGYRWNARIWFTRTYYAQRIVPALIATWGVWLPVVTLIYALPPLLQTPLFTLALSLWVLIYTWMAEER